MPEFELGYEFQPPEPTYESLEKAKSSAESVQELIENIASNNPEGIRFSEYGSRLTTETTLNSSKPNVKIQWESGNSVTFQPILEGKGSEAAVLGYNAFYTIEGERNELSTLVKSKNRIEFHLADSAFAIEKNPINESYDIYAGLGYLLIDEANMYILLHELGHADHFNDDKYAFLATTNQREYEASIRSRKIFTELYRRMEDRGAEDTFSIRRKKTGIDLDEIQIRDWAGLESYQHPKAKRVNRSAKNFADKSRRYMEKQHKKAVDAVNKLKNLR